MRLMSADGEENPFLFGASWASCDQRLHGPRYNKNLVQTDAKLVELLERFSTST